MPDVHEHYQEELELKRSRERVQGHVELELKRSRERVQGHVEQRAEMQHAIARRPGEASTDPNRYHLEQLLNGTDIESVKAQMLMEQGQIIHSLAHRVHRLEERELEQRRTIDALCTIVMHLDFGQLAPEGSLPEEDGPEELED